MREQSLQIDGLKINYRKEGSGPCILILHGWDSSSDRWQETGEILARNGFQVLIPDLPGFGKSGFPPFPWSVGDYLELIVKFVERIKCQKPFLFGHSFGGRIAIKFGAVYPEKISGLILCAAGGIISRKRMKVKIFYFLAKLGKFFFSMPIIKGSQGFVRRVFYRLAGVRDYLKASPIMKETMKKMISEDLTPFLNQINLKTLIIWGKKDKILPLSDAHLIKEKIPNSDLIVMEDIGHAPNLEAPEKLAKIILNWYVLQRKHS